MFEKKFLYKTKNGKAIVGDSLELMKLIPDNSINLVITSPPFALSRPKKYTEMKIKLTMLTGFYNLQKR